MTFRNQGIATLKPPQVIPEFVNELTVIPLAREIPVLGATRKHQRGQFTLCHHDANGHSATMQVPVEPHGNPPVTAPNAQYLADFLHIGSTLGLGDGLSPGICRHPTAPFNINTPLLPRIEKWRKWKASQRPRLHRETPFSSPQNCPHLENS